MGGKYWEAKKQWDEMGDEKMGRYNERQKLGYRNVRRDKRWESPWEKRKEKVKED